MCRLVEKHKEGKLSTMTGNLSIILSAISRNSRHYKPSDTLPKPFKGKHVKAILLGADPGTMNNQKFEYVFKLEIGDSSPYFKQFIPNLQTVGLSLDNLYVQNLCRNYFDCDTMSHQKDWMNCAQLWVDSLKEELDAFDPRRALPVLISAYVILQALCSGECEKPDFYYSNHVFVDKNQNLLGRTLIPFFRGGAGKYRLVQKQWTAYTKKIREELTRKANDR